MYLKNSNGTYMAMMFKQSIPTLSCAVYPCLELSVSDLYVFAKGCSGWSPDLNQRS